MRPTFSPARLCHVVYAGFSGGQMEDYPCVGQHISRRKNARRLSPSDLRTTLPDLRALAKRPLASPHRAANWRRSVDDQPRACSQHRRARLSLQASAREGLAETPRGLGQAAQNDARFGGADRRKTDARAVESRSDQRASGEGWRRLYQSRAHLSACLERQERRGHAVSSLASQRQKIQQAQGQEFGARADSEPRRYRSAASYCRRKKPHRRLGGRHDYRRQSQRRCHVARRANLQIHQARQTAGQERGLCRAGLRTRALAAR